MYKENYEFPAIIINHSCDDYEIRIYDFDEVTVYDDNLDSCYALIKEALEAEIYKYICLNKEIPSPTAKEEITLDYNQTLFDIKINTEEAIRNSKRLGVIVPKEL
ncbi:type II toxin-antitoxin system HicB family antitoxin [Intestinibacter sp.]|uniref:type II toxin-antitoxin system HicB family antitoxin n=1 Tax=Intestinibacter sp. TaxID=1965304 RepID=UPI002A9161BB|nr:hypothetical protein [Intestinibacter sp.]MDY5212613.1 hypothetical protein [Intestinibacter sp.]